MINKSKFSDIKVQICDNKNRLDLKIDELVNENSSCLIYYSKKYRDFLNDILKKSDPLNFCILKKNIVIGFIPNFIFRDKEFIVSNSLPYYGSNGGLFLNKSLLDKEEKIHIVKICLNHLKQIGCHSSTFIANPYENDFSHYQNNDFDFITNRSCQITNFKKDWTLNSIDKNLYEIFHYKTRNALRKGLKNNFTIKATSADESLDFLFKTHKENMEVIGGIHKSFETLKKLTEYFSFPDNYKIWVAEDASKKKIAALLLLYYNNRIEYYTPVIKHKYRSSQCLSAIIFNAMKDGFKNGYNEWNWGGTWLEQTSVYRFKSRWGAKDRYYQYYTKIFDKSILNLSKETVIKNFPNFFVFPFKR